MDMDGRILYIPIVPIRNAITYHEFAEFNLNDDEINNLSIAVFETMYIRRSGHGDAVDNLLSNWLMDLDKDYKIIESILNIASTYGWQYIQILDECLNFANIESISSDKRCIALLGSY